MSGTPAIVVGAALVALALAASGAFVALGRRAVFWLAVTAPFVPLAYVDRYHFRLPPLVKWAPFLAIALAAAVALLLYGRRELRIPRAWLLGYAAILAVSLASARLNDTSAAAFVVAQRGFAMLFCSLVALSVVVRRYDKDRVSGFLVRLGVLSCAICVLQRVFVVPTVADAEAGDRVTGLFSVSFIALFFHLYCVGLVLSYWLHGRRLPGLAPVPTLGLLVLGIAVGNDKAGLPLLVALVGLLGLCALARFDARRAWKILAASIALPAAVLLVFTPIYDRAYGVGERDSYARTITDPAYLHRYLFGEGEDRFTPAGRLLRGAAIVFAWNLVDDDPWHLLLGRGPGASSESRLPGGSGWLTALYPGYAIDRTGLSMVLVETGLLGLLANLAFLWLLARPPPSSLPEPVEQRWARAGFVLLTALYLVYDNMYYEPVWGLLAAFQAYPFARVVRARAVRAAPASSAEPPLAALAPRAAADPVAWELPDEPRRAHGATVERARRIVVTIRSLDNGGAERQAVLLARALAHRHHVRLVVASRRRAHPKHVAAIRAARLRVDFLPDGGVRKLVAFVKLLRAERADAIFSHLPGDTALAAIAGRLAGVPCVLGGVRNERVARWKLPLLRALHNHALDFSISNSEAGREAMVAAGFDASRLLVLENGIELPERAPGRVAHRALRVLWLGRFVEQKDPETALEAIARLRDALPPETPLTCLFAGWGPLEAAVRERIRALGLGDVVRLVVDPPDPARLYAAADVFLSSSRFEGLSNTLMEAMSWRCPIVCTDVGGNAQLVSDGVNGFLAPPGDAGALALGLARLADDAGLRARFGEEGYRRVSERYSFAAFARRYLSLVERIA